MSGPSQQIEPTGVLNITSDEDSLNKILAYQRTAPNTLTMPQSDPSMPPRPEFPPFVVDNLCGAVQYDCGDFATYPERHRWVVHHKDMLCHPLCPPFGICFDGIERRFQDDYYMEHGPVSPMLSRTDGSTVTHTSKVAFFQTWLFFGALHEMSKMCGLTMDVQAEFLVDGGRGVSTAALNGLAGRWFLSLSSQEVGREAFMWRVLTIARQISLLLAQEVSSRPEGKTAFEYTSEEAHVLFSIEVLLRVLSLHLLLHAKSPALSHSDAERWDGILSEFNNYALSIQDREGDLELCTLEKETLSKRGWCPSEIQGWFPDRMDGFKLALSLLVRSHRTCDYTMCLAYQVNEKTYKTAHVDPDCFCDFIGVSSGALVAKLEEDHVPIVTITENLEMKVVASADCAYIALSHVCE